MTADEAAAFEADPLFELKCLVRAAACPCSPKPRAHAPQLRTR